MRTTPADSRDWILMTGATGILGPALACELLSRGRRVICLVRAATPAAARRRVVSALGSWSSDVERLLETGRLAVLRGDVHEAYGGLAEQVRAGLRGRVAALVHAAGNTRFAAASDGEPQRTNVTGTGHILELAREIDCRDWHLISTAYVAGMETDAREAVATAPPAFRNAYERSKWDGEQAALRAARASDAALTIYRPSIVVGHSETGRVTRFTGIYYLFRATSLLARAADESPDVDRRAIPLYIPALPDRRPNLICIDDVAREFGDLFDCVAARGGVYHLTHPAPPSNARIKRVLEACYDIAGGRFAARGHGGAERGSNPAAPLARFQELFDQMTETVSEYLFDAPRFDRREVDRFVARQPAEWTDERLRLLVRAAEAVGWRPVESDRYAEYDRREIAAYFREFLPKEMAATEGERVESLDLSVRFCIGGSRAGQWWCRFRNGRPTDVEPAADQEADVVYHTSESRFWAAVSGEISGAELFLSGQARIDGDIERALKFAMVLEAFVSRRPYRPALRSTPDAPPAH